MTDHARDVLSRAQSTEQQITVGLAQLVALGDADPCSDASLGLMRRIDLTSSYIQAIGHVVGDSIVCSSLGMQPGDLDIGPVEMVEPNGEKLRTNVEFPAIPGQTFVVVERDGFAAIVHRGLVLDVAAQAKEVSLALFTRTGPRILESHGEIKAEWLNALQTRAEAAFVDDTHAVAIVAASNSQIAALAAEPKGNLDQRARDVAIVVLPIAVIAALGLALAVLYLAVEPQQVVPVQGESADGRL